MSKENWSIEKGDYRRDKESTSSYAKQIRRKKLIIDIIKSVGIIIAITIIAIIFLT